MTRRKPAKKKAAKKTTAKKPSISLVDTKKAKELVKRAAAAGEPIDELVTGTPDERELAKARANQCAHDLSLVLEHHRCRIMPVIRPDQVEPVGLDGSKVQITATYYVAPLP